MTYRERQVEAYYLSKNLWETKFSVEAKFLDMAIEMCELLGAVVIRQAFATKRGVSDLLVCYKGAFIAAELKDDTGEPSVQQLAFIGKIKKAGGRAAVVDTLGQLFDLVLGTTEDAKNLTVSLL